MKHPLWSDEYWLLLMQLYLRTPTGVKPMYSRGMIDLSLELHIPPTILYSLMFDLRRVDTPHVQRLWELYGNSPKRLAKAVKMLRRMNGFSTSGGFYDGVCVQESFEKDFRPLPSLPQLMPVMLIITLDLYFRLTPITMVKETPEVIELARLMRVKPDVVADIMTAFRICDPYLHHHATADAALVAACQEVWSRYGNDNPETLAAVAAQMKEYFK